MDAVVLRYLYTPLLDPLPTKPTTSATETGILPPTSIYTHIYTLLHQLSLLNIDI